LREGPGIMAEQAEKVMKNPNLFMEGIKKGV